jgi:hypothetical protein
MREVCLPVVLKPGVTIRKTQDTRPGPRAVPHTRFPTAFRPPRPVMATKSARACRHRVVAGPDPRGF